MMHPEADVLKALEGVLTTSPGNFFSLSLSAILVGIAMMRVERIKTLGKLVLFFGAQSFMNIFIGWVMRTTVLLPKGTFIEKTGYTLETDLTGCPTGFALTCLQQFITFGVFWLGLGLLYPTPWRYTPKKLETFFEVRTVAITGCVFAFNIALNNLSLAYISVAVNLVLRSSLPLTTYVAQQMMSLTGLYPSKPIIWFEVFLMSFGVGCACVFTAAQVMSEGASTESSQTLLGVGICALSVVCASANMALTGVIGESNLKKYDAVAYMALPAAIVLLPLAIFCQNTLPGEWSKVMGTDRMTDVQILIQIWTLNRSALAWLALSGVFSFAYNVVLFEVIHTLDPTAACVGGNCNKAAVILLTMLVPALRAKPLPGMPYVGIMWSSVALNVLSFAWYNWLQIQAKAKQAPKDEGRALVRSEAEGASAAKGGHADVQNASASDSEDAAPEGWLSWARRLAFGGAGPRTAVVPADEESGSD